MARRRKRNPPLTEQEKQDRILLQILAHTLVQAYRTVADEFDTLDAGFPECYDEMGKTLKGYFDAMAEHCKNYTMDPHDYMRAVFRLIRRSMTYIIPKDIIDLYKNGSDIDRYLAAEEKLEDAATAWANMVRMLGDVVKLNIPKHYASIRDILMDPMQPFTACFRIFYPDTPDEEIIKRYAELAQDELTNDVRLKEYLTSTYPEHMRYLKAIIINM